FRHDRVDRRRRQCEVLGDVNSFPFRVPVDNCQDVQLFPQSQRFPLARCHRRFSGTERSKADAQRGAATEKWRNADLVKCQTKKIVGFVHLLPPVHGSRVTLREAFIILRVA
ncbi:unnamed protein product, partial [Ixodes persulcatus]